jgi:hypothetical protein
MYRACSTLCLEHNGYGTETPDMPAKDRREC